MQKQLFAQNINKQDVLNIDSLQQNFYIGYDLGTSFIKISIINSKNNTIGQITYPQKQMPIINVKQQFSQQDPQLWWKYICQGTQLILKETIQKNKIKNVQKIKGIGITYQMHGLVLIDKNLEKIRNSIIWCDSRAVQTGKSLSRKFNQQDKKIIDEFLLNQPSNFTLSKLKWVQQNEPQIYQKIHKFMLPGDYIAMKLTGQACISQGGLSQAILWNFKQNKLCNEALELSNISQDLVPKIVKNLSHQGKVTKQASKLCGLAIGTQLLYRAGDQTNNAFSLGVKRKGQISVSGGTSGTLYALTDNLQAKQKIKLNTFLHLKISQNEKQLVGKLICINACGSVYKWLKNELFSHLNYKQMDQYAEQIQIGSCNLIVIPFGNGCQRIFQNKLMKAQIRGLDFGCHTFKHILRASLESVAFTFVYSAFILKKEGFNVENIYTGDDNIFRSKIICQAVSCLLKCKIIKSSQTGSIGAAKAAFLSYQMLLKQNHSSFVQDFKINQKINFDCNFQPLKIKYQIAYQKWVHYLQKISNF